jgi:hypothetical protein
MKSLILTALTLAYTCAPVAAQQNCRPYAEFVKISVEQKATLRYKYKSIRQYFVEVWATDNAVIMIRRKDGLACISDMGHTVDAPV